MSIVVQQIILCGIVVIVLCTLWELLKLISIKEWYMLRRNHGCYNCKFYNDRYCYNPKYKDLETGVTEGEKSRFTVGGPRCHWKAKDGN